MTQRALQNILNEAEGLEGLGFYYSIYEGVVTDNNDPDKSGKLCIQIPIGAGVELKWVKPFDLHSGKDRAEYDIPSVKDNVQVMFRNGLFEFPIWANVGFWKDGEKPTQIENPDDYVRVFKNQIFIKVSKENQTYEIRTPEGVSILIDNQNKLVKTSIGDCFIEVHNDGLTIKKAGNSLKSVLTELGNAVKNAQTTKILQPTDLATMAGSNPAGAVVFAGTLTVTAPLTPSDKNAIQGALDKISEMFKA